MTWWFDGQFTETEWERRLRQSWRRRERTENGLCWQCGKKLADCECPNLSHERSLVLSNREGTKE